MGKKMEKKSKPLNKRRWVVEKTPEEIRRIVRKRLEVFRKLLWDGSEKYFDTVVSRNITGEQFRRLLGTEEKSFKKLLSQHTIDREKYEILRKNLEKDKFEIKQFIKEVKKLYGDPLLSYRLKKLVAVLLYIGTNHNITVMEHPSNVPLSKIHILDVHPPELRNLILEAEEKLGFQKIDHLIYLLVTELDTLKRELSSQPQILEKLQELERDFKSSKSLGKILINIFFFHVFCFISSGLDLDSTSLKNLVSEFPESSKSISDFLNQWCYFLIKKNGASAFSLYEEIPIWFDLLFIQAKNPLDKEERKKAQNSIKFILEAFRFEKSKPKLAEPDELLALYKELYEKIKQKIKRKYNNPEAKKMDLKEVLEIFFSKYRWDRNKIVDGIVKDIPVNESRSEIAKKCSIEAFRTIKPIKYSSLNSILKDANLQQKIQKKWNSVFPPKYPTKFSPFIPNREMVTDKKTGKLLGFLYKYRTHRNLAPIGQ